MRGQSWPEEWKKFQEKEEEKGEEEEGLRSWRRGRCRDGEMRGVYPFIPLLLSCKAQTADEYLLASQHALQRDPPQGSSSSRPGPACLAKHERQLIAFRAWWRGKGVTHGGGGGHQSFSSYRLISSWEGSGIIATQRPLLVLKVLRRSTAGGFRRQTWRLRRPTEEPEISSVANRWKDPFPLTRLAPPRKSLRRSRRLIGPFRSCDRAAGS